MKLKKLFKDIATEQIRGSKEIEITGICANSKIVAPGNLFVAKKGLTSHGGRFIPEAVSAGAVAVLTDIYDPSLKSVTQVIHPDVAAIEGEIALRFYEEAASQLFMVGITGTNGKTTTSYLVRHLLSEFKGPCGLIGTIEYVIGNQRYQAVRTTPDVFTNHRLLRDMWKHGCQSAVMEVTSHALDQGRAAKIDFDVAIFTNLTLDHLDYHKTMENYCMAKNRLFRFLFKPGCAAIVNADSPWLQKVIEGCRAKIYTYGIDSDADIRASQIALTLQGTTFLLTFAGETVECKTPLIGRFNVYNTLCAIATAINLKVPLPLIVEKLRDCPFVPGRLEPVANSRGLKIYVDFAHSDDALRNVFETLSDLKKGRIITVFGCGGDRDFTKRPKMAEVCEHYSDISIVTSDNPRSEDPEKIGREIIQGFKCHDSYIVELDRRLAIRRAVELAVPEDIILIAGKGHEKSQIFAHHTIEFDDCKVAKEACEELSYV
jgi:UDP-N-acetylmuramoyl-L-alanyl-D-glutamate--2,6-diaminopimelate ligase